MVWFHLCCVYWQRDLNPINFHQEYKFEVLGTVRENSINSCCASSSPFCMIAPSVCDDVKPIFIYSWSLLALIPFSSFSYNLDAKMGFANLCHPTVKINPAGI